MIVDKYADIIDLPHHVSTVHPQMSMLSRAAQFAPFSALNGHSDAIAATALRNEQAYTPKTTTSKTTPPKTTTSKPTPPKTNTDADQQSTR